MVMKRKNLIRFSEVDQKVIGIKPILRKLVKIILLGQS